MNIRIKFFYIINVEFRKLDIHVPKKFLLGNINFTKETDELMRSSKSSDRSSYRGNQLLERKLRSSISTIYPLNQEVSFMEKTILAHTALQNTLLSQFIFSTGIHRIHIRAKMSIVDCFEKYVIFRCLETLLSF